ncbi:hypothetical protein [Olivibacter sitiensis]|uniref:hypothetical protein n=1 Tax=Olivibacter sitiensis TaxID=376470 RepID=UPI0003FD7E14|nr:hypothetical protein [Olivibacter sitiensis]
MKTSNILLIATGVLLLSAIFINAFALKYKIDHGDYTIRNDIYAADLGKKEMQRTDLAPGISKVALKGPLSELDILIKYDTVAHADITKGLPIVVKQEGETLSISYAKNIPDNLDSLWHLANQRGNISIYLNSLKDVSNEGIAFTVTHGKGNNTSSETVYFGCKITLDGFREDSLHIEMRKAGRIHFNDLAIKSIALDMDGQAVATIDSTSQLGQLSLTGRDWAKFELNKAAIKTLNTDLQNEAEIKLKGTRVQQ